MSISAFCFLMSNYKISKFLRYLSILIMLMNLNIGALKCLMDISSLGLNVCIIKQITSKNMPFWDFMMIDH